MSETPFDKLVSGTDLAERVQEFSDVFSDLIIARHETGAEAYGPLGFVTNDVVRMMIEELADMANYARYQAIKLMMLGEVLRDEIEGLTVDELGFNSFKGTGEEWKK